MLLLLILSSTASAQKLALVSAKNTDVTGSTGTSDNKSVSASGRFVAFESTGFDLSTVNDVNSGEDIFVRDQEAGVTITVSVNQAGTATGNSRSLNPVISADGRFVVFESDASNLVSGDTNNSRDIFVRDLQTSTTTLVSAGAGGAAANGGSQNAVISAAGNVVVFASFASNLVNGDSNNKIDVFARNLQAGTTALVSANSAGTGSGNESSYFDTAGINKFYRKVISDSGRFVVFVSLASDLSPLDTDNVGDAYVRDLQTNVTTLVSVSKTGTAGTQVGARYPVISPDGRFVVFESSSGELTSNDTHPSGEDLFLRDLQTSTTHLVTVTRSNTGVNASSFTFYHGMSTDGRFVTFASDSDNLVDGDANGRVDVFVRDMQTDTTTRASVGLGGPASGGGTEPVVSPDGRFVAFYGFSTDLVATPDTNKQGDVFLRDIPAGTTTLVSTNAAGTSAGVTGSSLPVLSRDGRILVFTSGATDLAPNQIKGGIQVLAAATDGRVQFEAASYSAGESDGSVTVTLKRTGNTADVASIYYTTAGGNAKPGTDYTPVSGTLNFLSGEDTKTFSVPVLDDGNDEPDEGVVLVLSDFTQFGRASLGMVVLNIADDDPPPTVSINDVTVTEGNSGTANAVFTLTLSAASGKTVTVNVSAGGGTADGSDYRLDFTQVAFGPGTTTATLPVKIFGDGYFESDETFNVNLSAPSNATIADAQGLATIRNDDPVPSVFVEDVFVAEGDSGTNVAQFPISLSNPSASDITFNYTTSDATAAAGSDYTALSGTLTIPAGQTKTFIPVQVNGDTVNEASETFLLTLSNPTGASIVRGQAVANIMNDDSPALVQFISANYSADEGGPNAVINVTRSGDTAGELTVDYYTLKFAADDRSDYTYAAGTLRFAPGELSKSFTVFITDDVYVEPIETLSVVLVNPNGTNGASLGSPSVAQLVIRSDDTAPANNPIDSSQFFVRQHYRDFLNREPDAAGLAFWTNEIEKCGTGTEAQQCRDVRRINVSAAFFKSIEFQETGYLVYRLHGAAFDAGERLPLGTFLTDTQEIGRDLVVGEQGWEQKIEANKVAFVNRFVQRPTFKARYPDAMPASQFVDALNANTGDPLAPGSGGSLTQAERDQLVSELSSGVKTRAQVLRAVAENAEYRRRLVNNAFVYMQYVGYLRRGPIDAPDRDFSGYQFWLSKLNQFNGDFVRAEMVKAFISSDEYRKRFGQ